jgi:hypothetical protein
MVISSMHDLEVLDNTGTLNQLGDGDIPALLAIVALELREIRMKLQ